MYEEAHGPRTRNRRRQARQQQSYGIHHLLVSAFETMETIAVRIGHETKVPDAEMRLIADMCPNLTAIGIPCPVLSEAVANGSLSREDVIDLEEQTVSLDKRKIS